jgi:hypothetical protein
MNFSNVALYISHNVTVHMISAGFTLLPPWLMARAPLSNLVLNYLNMLFSERLTVQNFVNVLSVSKKLIESLGLVPKASHSKNLRLRFWLSNKMSCKKLYQFFWTFGPLIKSLCCENEGETCQHIAVLYYLLAAATKICPAFLKGAAMNDNSVDSCPRLNTFESKVGLFYKNEYIREQALKVHNKASF